jgi:hypothetical protein
MRLMRTPFALLGAMLLLGVLATGGAARILSGSETRITTTFPAVQFGGGFGTVRCSVTAAGAFHERTIAKVLETLSGLVTSASIGGCATGGATVLRETLPWHARYSGFSGTLPNITSIIAKMIGLRFQVREPVFGITCLATSSAASPATVSMSREAGGRITSSVMGGTISTNCGINGTLNGTTNAMSALTVTLI